MPRMETEQFLKMSRFKNNYSKWESDGINEGWIHPKIGIWSRLRHQSLPVPPTEDKGKWGFKSFNCAGDNCPLCQLRNFAELKLKEYMGSDGRSNAKKNDFVVLTGEDQDGKDRSYTLVDLAEVDRERYKKGISAFNETILPWIRLKDRDKNSPVEIIFVKPSLASEIRGIIERQIQKRGNKKGDPMLTPYAFELSYDKKEKNPSKRYSAAKMDSTEAIIDENVEKIMAMDEKKLNVDLALLCDPGDSEEMLDLLEAIWDEDSKLTFKAFKKFRSQFEDEEEETTSKKKRKNTEDEDSDDSEDEDSEDEKPKGKKSKKKSEPEDDEDDEDSDDEESEDEDEEEVESEDDEDSDDEESDDSEDDEDDEPIYKKMKNRGDRLGKDKKEDGQKHGVGGKSGKSGKEGKKKRGDDEGGSRNKDDKGKKGSSDKDKSTKKSTFCNSCNMKVKPTSKGLCPECAEELDVP